MSADVFRGRRALHHRPIAIHVSGIRGEGGQDAFTPEPDPDRRWHMPDFSGRSVPDVGTFGCADQTQGMRSKDNIPCKYATHFWKRVGVRHLFQCTAPMTAGGRKRMQTAVVSKCCRGKEMLEGGRDLVQYVRGNIPPAHSLSCIERYTEHTKRIVRTHVSRTRRSDVAGALGHIIAVLETPAPYRGHASLRSTRRTCIYT